MPKDEKTQIIKANDAAPRPAAPAGDDKTELILDVAASRLEKHAHPRGDINDRQTTKPTRRPVWPARDQNRPPPEAPVVQGREDGLGDKTRFFGHRPSAGPEVAPGGESADPVVGWLVVVRGAGRGHAHEIGVGVNHIGRSPDQKLCIDHGDQSIHRARHSAVVYDPRSRSFHVQAGEVRSLTYVDGKAVLTPMQIFGGEILTVGATDLRFVPFCGPKFDWSAP